MTKNGIDKPIAEAIWELFPPFGRYGFNRCLSGGTTVMDPTTGDLVSLRELYRRNRGHTATVFSLEPSQKIKARPIADVIYNGKKQVWMVRTRSGRNITATTNHPFLTPNGWQKLEDIGVGMKLAVPRILPEPSVPLTAKQHKLGLLGYLLAEGNLCHPHGFYFYSKTPEEIADYLRYLEAFTNTVGRIDANKAATAVYAKRKNSKRPSGAVRWIERLGLKYKKAAEKFFPDFVYRLSNHDLALVLAKMFQGDGCINLARNDPQIFYATSSPAIASALQHFLLRFGILSTIHEKKFKYRGGVRIGYTVTINRYDNIGKFIEAFGPHFVGEKAIAVKRIAATHPILNGSLFPWAARGSHDTIPVVLVRERIRNAVNCAGLSFSEFAWQNDISKRLFGRDRRKTGYLRETIAFIAERIGEPELADIAGSDIYWDEIAAIEPAGEEDTYDLTVDETHNFVANDIIVHNSHAASYALVAYQTAYLKAHYPAEFMAAIMTAEGFEVERVATLIDECRAMGLRVLPPSISESTETFTVVGKDEIRFGLASVKNVGTNIVRAIIDARGRGERFSSITDFIEKVQRRDLNKKSLESLIRSGAMDELGERGQLLENLDSILGYSHEHQRQAAKGQESLFASIGAKIGAGIRLSPAEPASKKDKLAWERELLGLYVSEHPLEEYREKFQNKVIPVKDLQERSRNSLVEIGGLVQKIKKIITKAGSPMLFVTLEDLTGKTEVLVFPRVLERTGSVWQEDKVVRVKGRISDSVRDDGPKVLCEEAVEIT